MVTTSDKNGDNITEQSEITTEPLVEMVLTTYEKQMSLVDGNLISIKELKTRRIGLSINAMESLATQLKEWIEETKEIQTRLETGTLQCLSEQKSKTSSQQSRVKKT